MSEVEFRRRDFLMTALRWLGSAVLLAVTFGLCRRRTGRRAGCETEWCRRCPGRHCCPLAPGAMSG